MGKYQCIRMPQIEKQTPYSRSLFLRVATGCNLSVLPVKLALSGARLGELLQGHFYSTQSASMHSCYHDLRW